MGTLPRRHTAHATDAARLAIGMSPAQKPCPSSLEVNSRLGRRQRFGSNSNYGHPTDMRGACKRGSFLTINLIGLDFFLRSLAPKGPKHPGMHHDQQPGKNANPHRGQVDSH